jgi:hypothetical protein
MTLAVTEQHGAAGVPAGPGRTGAGVTARLRVDRGDPFFFDGPLDHVPDLLLVAGLLDLVRGLSGSGQATDRVSLSLTFPGRCGLEEPTILRVVPHTIALTGQVRGWAVRAVHAGRSVCAGLASPYRTDPPEITQGPAGSPIGAVDRRLVHQARPEHVLIGQAQRIGSEYRFPVLPPPPGTVLSGRVAGGYRVEALIESGRQLSTMLAHTVAGHPLDTRPRWSTLDADLPWWLPEHAEPALLYHPDPAQDHLMRYRAVLVGAAAGEFHGTVRYGCAAAGPVARNGRAR